MTTKNEIKKTIAQLEQEQQELIEKFFDKENNCWRAATPEETKNLQARMRSLKNQIRFIQEEMIVKDKETPADLKAQLFPLFSRREAPHKIGFTRTIGVHLFNIPDYKNPQELEEDGERFCFEPETLIDVQEQTCGCGHYYQGWQPKNHTEIQEALAHMKICPKINTKVVKEPLNRIKHVRGDWECRGCLNSGKPMQAEEGLAALAAVKFLEWCPNFPEWARSLTLQKALDENEAHKNSSHYDEHNMPALMCYAGLMHSQMEFGEREEKDGKIIQHIKIVRLCDTCGHRIEENKTSEWDANLQDELTNLETK